MALPPNFGVLAMKVTTLACTSKKSLYHGPKHCYTIIAHELPKKITCESYEFNYKSFLSVLQIVFYCVKSHGFPLSFNHHFPQLFVPGLGLPAWDPLLKPRRGSVPPRQRHLLPRAALVRSLGLGAADAAAGGAVLSHGLLLGVRS